MIHSPQNYVKSKFYQLKFPSANVKINWENEKDLLFLKYKYLEEFLARLLSTKFSYRKILGRFLCVFPFKTNFTTNEYFTACGNIDIFLL